VRGSRNVQAYWQPAGTPLHAAIPLSTDTLDASYVLCPGSVPTLHIAALQPVQIACQFISQGAVQGQWLHACAQGEAEFASQGPLQATGFLRILGEKGARISAKAASADGYAYNTTCGTASGILPVPSAGGYCNELFLANTCDRAVGVVFSLYRAGREIARSETTVPALDTLRLQDVTATLFPGERGMVTFRATESVRGQFTVTDIQTGLAVTYPIGN